MQYLSPQAQSVVNQVIEGYKPEKVILFGSHATGQATQDSDYDLFLVKDTGGTFASRQYDVWKSITDWSIPCDFIVYTPQEIQEAKKTGSWFLDEIESSGKVLYDS